MAFAVPNTVSVGTPVTAAQQNVVAGDFQLMTFASYTPVLAAAVTNPTLGSGSSAIGYYAQVGKMVMCRIAITFGTSGVVAGSGAYSIFLPVLANTASDIATWGCRLFDSSSSNSVTSAVGVMQSNSTFGLQYATTAPIGALTNVGAALPWTWAANDFMTMWVAYQAA